jgi:hypothetical protein
MSLHLAARSSRVFSSTRRLQSLTAQLQSRINPVQAFTSNLTHTTRFSSTMSSLPKSMSGVIIEKTGGSEVLQWKTDLSVPTPKEGEILVKNDYVGINFIDTFVSVLLLRLMFFHFGK